MATMWGARDQLLVDITQAAQKRIKKQLYVGSEAAKEDIEAVCRPIAATFNGVVVTADLKGVDRASEKVGSDYGGDWYGIKDVARMTIIVPTENDCLGLLKTLELTFVASRGYGVLGRKDVSAREDACGYSGHTIVVRTRNGWPGEIQVNIPPIIYAKQSERSVRRSLGDKAYIDLKAKFGLDGGMGHKLYEIYRAGGMGLTPAAKEAARLSQAYYGYFRGLPDPKVAAGLKAQLMQVLGWRFNS